VASRSRPRPIVSNSPAELESAVRERCLNLLAQQPRTRAELERSLARAAVPDDAAAAVLDRLSQVGLVDDTVYAQAYMRTGIGVRRRGTRSLRAELRARGVAPDVIEAAAAQVDEGDERATALALASRRAAGLVRLAPDVRRRRLTGLLLRRGFGASVVSEVVAQVLAESEDDEGSGLSPLDIEEAEAFSEA
jgi:regulatory protein